MDMDLWWCPVCERAITEKKDTPMDLIKRSSDPPSPLRQSTRGSAYVPQESLYCSEECRRIEESNGRFAFEQLAACLPAFIDNRTYQEDLESEGTLSGTDEPNTDRSRSLSLGKSSTSASQRTSTSSSSDVNLPNQVKLRSPLSTNFHQLSLQVRPTARRVPILLSPNGTPLVQPIFPQRPAIAPHQRPHHLKLSALKPSFPSTTTAVHAFKPSARYSVKPSNSAPTGAPNNVGHLSISDGTRSVLKTLAASKNDMEFDPEARFAKPTFLWRHYGLFYRPQPGSRRGEWVECSSPTEMESDSFKNWHRNFATSDQRVANRNRGATSTKSQNNLLKNVKKPNGSSHDHDSRGEPRTSSTMDVYATQEIPTLKFSSKNRKTNLLTENKCSRSWSWNHLPADVPQYPAMDLELIRVSKMMREKNSSQHTMNSNDPIETQIKSSSLKNSSSATTMIPSFKVPIQTKKKLFLFQ